MMRAPQKLRAPLSAVVLLLLACGQDLPALDQPGPEALSPDTSSGGGSVAALPLPRQEAEPLPASPTPPTESWMTVGLGPDLGLVVWSGVSPQDDRPPPPPEDARGE